MSTHEASAATQAVELSAGLPVLELCRVRRYAGAVARITRTGVHRLLELRAKCADGRGLMVWVSCSALEDEECRQLAQRLSAFPDQELVVGFHGRFADVMNPKCLTTDIHYPRSIWVHTAEQSKASHPKDEE